MARGVPCTEHPAPRVYVAGPIFTPEQLAAVRSVVDVVHGAGYDSYSPERDGIMLSPTDPPERRDEVFYSNLHAIRQSDVLIALLDTKDTGTIWEMGVAMAYGLPVIAVTMEVPQMNVMLERGVVAHVRTPDDLTLVLNEVQQYVRWGRKSTNRLRQDEALMRVSYKQFFSYSGKTQ